MLHISITFFFNQLKQILTYLLSLTCSPGSLFIVLVDEGARARAGGRDDGGRDGIFKPKLVILYLSWKE